MAGTSPAMTEITLALQRSALLSQRVPARDFRFHRVNLLGSRRGFSRCSALNLHFRARRRHQRLRGMDRTKLKRLGSHRSGG